MFRQTFISEAQRRIGNPRMTPGRQSWLETAVKRLRFFYYRLPDWSVVTATFVILLFIFFYKLIFSNLIFARGDTFLYFYPYWEMAAEALRSGRVPLWNPYIFMGAPFLANSQIGFFYPLNWPVWILFSPPYAVKVSIVIHLLIAAWGAYLAGERALGLDRSAALVTAVLFAFGGYFTAQFEHVNQLQGLAWLPWYLVVLTYAGEEKVSSAFVVIAKTAVGLGLLFSLQLLAGHSQTAFISGVMVLAWGGAKIVNYHLNMTTENSLLFRFAYMRFRIRAPLGLLIGLALTALLTAVQLLPTYQLTQLSSRAGGLQIQEALSFSLHPLLLTRAILPAYHQSLFTEYTVFLPGSAIVLACIGGWQWRRWRGVLPAIVLVLIGLLLGIGQFNPLNWLIMRLPGFNLFRVPARWFVLYALGISLLAGLGWQIAIDRYLMRTLSWRQVPERARETLWHMERPLRLGIYILIGLILWSTLASILAIFIPTGPESPYEAPNRLTMSLWLLELFVVFLWLSGQRIRYDSSVRLRFVILPGRVRHPWLIGLMMGLLLFMGSRTQPYHLNLTAPEAYFDLRSSVSRLETTVFCPPSPDCNTIPGRILTLSNIQFDPGDTTELKTIYQDSLSEIAWMDFIVAIKQQEIVGPNLAMDHGLSTVDGFDGGILPLRTYSNFVSQLLPDGVSATDGRLREHLTAVPPGEWLDKNNVQYLITDKTGDQWLQITPQHNAFFDMQHPVSLQSDQTISIGYVPDFAADSFILAGEGAPPKLILEDPGQSGAAQILPTETIQSVGWRYTWPSEVEAPTMHLEADAPVMLHGAVLFNEEDGAFFPLVLGSYRLIFSGDVKIYENLDVLPRIYLANQAESAPMPSIDLLSYNFEEVKVRVDNKLGDTLIFSDAHYPGWMAEVDGEQVDIEVIDGFVRGINLAPGLHEVRFFFDSQTYIVGRAITFLGLFILGFLLITFAVLRATALKR